MIWKTTQNYEMIKIGKDKPNTTFWTYATLITWWFLKGIRVSWFSPCQLFLFKISETISDHSELVPNTHLVPATDQELAEFASTDKKISKGSGPPQLSGALYKTWIGSHGQPACTIPWKTRHFPPGGIQEGLALRTANTQYWTLA